MFIIISGVSGSGKNTIISELLKRGDNRFLIKSATTRQRRSDGLDDKIYDFYTDGEFDKKEANGEFFEVINVHTHRSATQFKELDKIIQNPQNVYFKDIDVIGAQKLVAYLKGKAKVLTIFLEVPDNVLYDRLIKRGESEEKAKLRLSRGEMERKFKDKYDLVIENLDMEKTLDIIEKKIKKIGR